MWCSHKMLTNAVGYNLLGTIHVCCIASCLDINGCTCMLNYFQRTVNLYCSTSCTMLYKTSIYFVIPWKDITKILYLQKFDESTRFCDTLHAAYLTRVFYCSPIYSLSLFLFLSVMFSFLLRLSSLWALHLSLKTSPAYVSTKPPGLKLWRNLCQHWRSSWSISAKRKWWSFLQEVDKIHDIPDKISDFADNEFVWCGVCQCCLK